MKNVKSISLQIKINLNIKILHNFFRFAYKLILPIISYYNMKNARYFCYLYHFLY